MFKMKGKQRITIVFLFLAVFMIYSVSSTFGVLEDKQTPIGLIVTEEPPLQISGEIITLEPQNPINEKSQEGRDCNKLGFCWESNRCYGVGVRITRDPEYKNKELSWLNETHLYCGEESKKFVSQKITGESCENDFECQSNSCVNLICEQKHRINVTEIYNDKETLIRNLFFQEKEMFYFSGLNKNYSMGFDKNESNFVFLINNETYILGNETFNLDNYSQITIEGISFENGLSSANLTLIESKNLLDNLDLKKDYENNNSEKIKENEISITGNAIEEGLENKNNLISKIINFFKDLFRF